MSRAAIWKGVYSSFVTGIREAKADMCSPDTIVVVSAPVSFSHSARRRGDDDDSRCTRERGNELRGELARDKCDYVSVSCSERVRRVYELITRERGTERVFAMEVRGWSSGKGMGWGLRVVGWRGRGDRLFGGGSFGECLSVF